MLSPHDYIKDICKRMFFIRAQPPILSRNYPGFMPKELQHYTHVLVCVDTTKHLLQPPYEISRTDKTVTIDTRDTLSIDQMNVQSYG